MSGGCTVFDAVVDRPPCDPSKAGQSNQVIPQLLCPPNHSAQGYAWQRSLGDDALEQTIGSSLGLDSFLAEILVRRGIDTVDKAKDFLAPKLREQLPDPIKMMGMGAAVERLVDAIINQTPIGIFGDYDVDGTAGCALLYDYLSQVGVPLVEVVIPHRSRDGYDLNARALADFRSKNIPLVVSVDCGIKALKVIGQIKDLDIIVTDHHQPGPSLPKALAVINPSRQDDYSGLDYLCGTGVVFMLLVALNRRLREENFFQAYTEPDLMARLDLVALATVCDMVPLIGVNRLLVKRGLAVLDQGGRPGLKALARCAGIARPFTSGDLGFALGPRLNAAGRMADARQAFDLLVAGDDRAFFLAERLDRLNRQRQEMERAAVASATKRLDTVSAGEDQSKCIFLADKAWPAGIIGLIASRLCRGWHQPAFIFSIDDMGQAVGSARSPAGVDIGAWVDMALEAGLITRGGGHRRAAGLSLPAKGLDNLRQFFDQIDQQEFMPQPLAIDGILSINAIGTDLWQLWQQLEPFGQANPSPHILVKGVVVDNIRCFSRHHLGCYLRSWRGAGLKAQAFFAWDTALGQYLRQHQGLTVDVVGTVLFRRWVAHNNVADKVDVSFKIEDVVKHEKIV